ncbi:maltose O-acetyltransferase [Marchantia polymorpha subsp. ruderalis]|uniref:Maltose/galactoside acetyltransferase domain-containing protein n=2 Tax=Marchantia polymorpha TaxID=3197 RepID=A0AAF6BBR1_MARPO|nr:hypothetical protein MARPO_0126s0014 [Marchantia polymorpha]BBN09445.1 hypothetical protein Mp_4g19800 [Marchantia polymorpha subsp. ruderalis]|eukprot:PTQ30297.1 hypothetical protein MARPO_0126s0014 [Marchantia polymorpha]
MEKSEWQKMLDGELYTAVSPKHVEERAKGRRLQQAFNESGADELEARSQILKRWFGSCCDDTLVEPPLYVDYGLNIHVGKRFFANFDCVILDCARVSIGDNVKFGPKVQLYTASHPVEAHERNKGPELAFSISIGNNCWLGGGCIICPGVTIGDNTTIGAGSVVTKNIPSNVVAAGNPARVIKHLALPPST